MYYNLSTYDSTQKFGHDHLGKQSYGKPKLVHQYDLSEDEEEELDDFVDQVNNSKIAAKTGVSGKVKVSDFFRGRQDNAGPTKNQPMGLFEFSGYHTNPVRTGISPYKQPKHTGGNLSGGGSEQAFRTTGNYKRSGSYFGFSRPHKNLTTIEDGNIFNLDDILHPMERSFVRQQNKIKKILSEINLDKSFYWK